MAAVEAERAVVVRVGIETGGNTSERGFVAAPRGVIFQSREGLALMTQGKPPGENHQG
jgi:hypothetical protein